MKRYLTVLVLLVLLATMVAFAVPALAEEVDYKAMSTDELIAMRKSINDELRIRMASDASAVYNGILEVGVDIKPGTYLFTCMSVDDTYGKMSVLVNDDNGTELLVGDSTIINLSANDKSIRLQCGSCTIQQTVKPDWAP